MFRKILRKRVDGINIHSFAIAKLSCPSNYKNDELFQNVIKTSSLE